MNKYVITIAWSQTDHENVLVDGDSVEEAEKKVYEAFPGIHHITGTRLIHQWIIK